MKAKKFNKTEKKDTIDKSRYTLVAKKITIIVFVAILILLITFVLSSCITIKINTAKGSGSLTTKDFDVKDFSKLVFSGIGKIIIEQGDKESLYVEAEDNVINNIKVKTFKNKLDISFKKGILTVVPTKDIIFHLTVKDLDEIIISGAGSIDCDNLTASDLSIISSGAGNINLNITVESLDIDISGAGKVEVSGNVVEQSLNISGAGSYNAKDLSSEKCDINISGAGKAVVRVNKELDVKISGIGSVEYYGNPSVKQIISGISGSIKKLD